MESKNIIILLVVVILALAIVAGVMFTQKIAEKEPSKLKITSNKTLYEGDNLTLQLTDLNKTPLSNQKVNITVKDSKGKTVVNKSVETNSKGKAKVDLGLEKGKYVINVTYGGNENYAANNTTQKLTIRQEEKAVEVTPEPSQSDTSSNAEVAEEIDYNSPNSEYYKWDTDGSYHKKQEGASYVYAQDAVTGEWSYWANKT